VAGQEAVESVFLLTRAGDTLGVDAMDQVRQLFVTLRASDHLQVAEQEAFQRVVSMIGQDTAVVALRERAVLVTTIRGIGLVIVSSVAALTLWRSVVILQHAREVQRLAWPYTVKALHKGE
jgi:hypothetical protein